MAFDTGRAIRGAGAGALAALAWAAQQDADKRIFRSGYDDIALLGKLVTRGRGWRPIGLAIHLANGAAFGALYASFASRMPGPSWARGAAAGLAENFGGWPLVAAVDRLHPARDELPRLGGNRAALAQATWRHLLFGVVLGVLEERLNGRRLESPRPVAPPASSNGHGDISRAAHVQS